MTKSQNVDNTI